MKHKILYQKRNKLNTLIEDPKFWDDRKKAEKILKEKKGYDDLLDSHKQSENEIMTLYDIFKLAMKKMINN